MARWLLVKGRSAAVDIFAIRASYILYLNRLNHSVLVHSAPDKPCFAGTIEEAFDPGF